ncbi:hypothetical protein ACOMHN_039745 [Nucella lapillus]
MMTVTDTGQNIAWLGTPFSVADAVTEGMPPRQFSSRTNGGDSSPSILLTHQRQAIDWGPSEPGPRPGSPWFVLDLVSWGRGLFYDSQQTAKSAMSTPGHRGLSGK